MNPLVSINATLYFEVKNAAMYGGEGSVGYTFASFSDIQHIENLNDDFITDQKKIISKILGVSVDDVSLISKDAYITAMEGPDDEGEESEEKQV